MKSFILVSSLLLNTQLFARAVQYDLIKEKSPVEFEAKGNPSLLSIKGLKGKGAGFLKIDGELLSGNVFVDLNDFDTEMDTRNEHMKEKYLETGKPGFHQAILKIDKMVLPKDFPVKLKKIDKLMIESTLILHGTEKKILCSADLTTDGTELSGKVHFKVKLSDFGIEIPSFAGITIEDEIAVNAQFKSSAGTPQ